MGDSESIRQWFEFRNWCKKCDALAPYKYMYINNINFQGLNQKLLRLFLTVYPLLHGIWEAAVFCYQMAYVFGKSRVHSPLLKLAGVMLCTLSMDDIRAQSEQKSQAIFSPNQRFV